MSRIRLLSSCLVVCAILTASLSTFAQHRDGDPARDDSVVRIGVLAKRGPARCAQKWGLTASYLTSRIPGRRFVIRPLAHDEVVSTLVTGELDFVLVNPALYVEIEARHGASRICTLRNLHVEQPSTVYAAVIFCRADRSDIRDCRDLAGKRFMAVDERSFGGWQMAWRHLQRVHGVSPHDSLAELRFGKSHDAVVLAVLDGSVAAGTVRADTLQRMAAEGKTRLADFRVLEPRHELPFPHTTSTYPEWPLAKTRETSDNLARRVAIALMSLTADNPAARAAQCSGWSGPLNYQAVHACLRDIGVAPYDTVRTISPGEVLYRYWPWVTAAFGVLIVTALVALHVMRLNHRLSRAKACLEAEMSERTHAERALLRSEQMRAASEKLAAVGRLAAGVAHEINNPLTGVLSFAHLLRERELPDEQARADLDLIIRETMRASEIVQSLLDFSREQPMAREHLHPNDVIERTLHLLRGQKQLQGVQLETHLVEGLPAILGNSNQLLQVLVNLCVNACEAMPDGGTLRVTSRAEGTGVAIAVQDTGTGILLEHLDRVFDPFFTTKPVAKATGLGLSISYGIVQRHMGSIVVESTVGQGTTFTVTLPRVEPASSKNPESERQR